MTAELVETWERLKNALKLYQADLLLNPPCPAEQLQTSVTGFDVEFPTSLQSLLALNNGQRIDSEGIKKGIFKSISGWNVYERHVFLSFDEIRKAYKSFIGDKVLVDEFGINEIPFAIAVSPTHYGLIQYREAFCINSLTGAVSLIWTQHVDLAQPPEWQLEKFSRAGSLAEFLEKQIELYR